MSGEIESKATSIRGTGDARHLYNHAANGGSSATSRLERRSKRHHEPTGHLMTASEKFVLIQIRRRLPWKVSGPDPLENAIAATFPP
jgi:hypothetical protein